MDKFDTLISQSKHDITIDEQFVNNVMTRIKSERKKPLLRFNFSLFSFPLVAGAMVVLVLLIAAASLTFSNVSSSTKASQANVLSVGKGLTNSTPNSVNAPQNSGTIASAVSPASASSPSTTGSTSEGTDDASLDADLNSIDSGVSQSSQDLTTAQSGLNDQAQEITVPTN